LEDSASKTMIVGPRPRFPRRAAPSLLSMQFVIPGPEGPLEALLEEPEGAPRGAAVVCHPHPSHGGTMRNTIVFRTARALRAAGLVTLRFNFRGVEESAGTHDGKGAEEEDARAALDVLEARYPGLELWAAGYSFGSRTVCGLARRDQRIRRLLLVAFPVAVYDCSMVLEVERPGLLLFGGGDEFGTATELAQQFPRLPERLEVDEIVGADHFFRGRTPIVEERVREWALEAVGAEG